MIFRFSLIIKDSYNSKFFINTSNCYAHSVAKLAVFVKCLSIDFIIFTLNLFLNFVNYGLFVSVKVSTHNKNSHRNGN